MKTTSQPTSIANQDKDQLCNTSSQSLNPNEKSENFGWLTEHSRQFLASGYLSDGETPEKRIKAIADNAEKILNIPGSELGVLLMNLKKKALIKKSYF